MSLRFALGLPTDRADRADEFVSAESIAEIARGAEAAGFGAVFVTDHPAGDAKWLDTGGHHALDPFVALSFAAAATTTLKLLTNIYVAAYRNPFLGAKSILSLDVLSGGRLILGTAAGYLKPEFAALGVDFEHRGERLDEALDVLERIYTGDDIAFDGPGFHARGVRMRPLRGPRPPVWVGGNSKIAIRRAVSSFEGWAPFATPGIAKATRTSAIDGLDDLERSIGWARDYAESIGRTRPLDICFGASLTGASVDERRESMRRLQEIGVTWMTVGVPGDTREEVLAQVGRFAADFID